MSRDLDNDRKVRDLQRRMTELELNAAELIYVTPSQAREIRKVLYRAGEYPMAAWLSRKRDSEGPQIRGEKGPIKGHAMSTSKKPATHLTRGGPRVRCGLKASATVKDTRKKDRVTCANCLRGLAADAK